MFRLLLPYNKTILKMNIGISLFLTLISSIILLRLPSSHSPVYLILRVYVSCLMSGGFMMSAFYYELTKKKEYYFYYNLGLSKIRLIFNAYLLGFITVVPFIILMQYV